MSMHTITVRELEEKSVNWKKKSIRIHFPSIYCHQVSTWRGRLIEKKFIAALIHLEFQIFEYVRTPFFLEHIIELYFHDFLLYNQPYLFIFFLIYIYIYMISLSYFIFNLYKKIIINMLGDKPNAILHHHLSMWFWAVAYFFFLTLW